VGLQTEDAQELYRSLGFAPQPEFWSLVVGSWLGNDANAEHRARPFGGCTAAASLPNVSPCCVDGSERSSLSAS